MNNDNDLFGPITYKHCKINKIKYSDDYGYYTTAYSTEDNFSDELKLKINSILSDGINSLIEFYKCLKLEEKKILMELILNDETLL